MPEAILSSPFLVSRRRLVGGAVGIATGAAVVTGPAGGSRGRASMAVIWASTRSCIWSR